MLKSFFSKNCLENPGQDYGNVCTERHRTSDSRDRPCRIQDLHKGQSLTVKLRDNFSIFVTNIRKLSPTLLPMWVTLFLVKITITHHCVNQQHSWKVVFSIDLATGDKRNNWINLIKLKVTLPKIQIWTIFRCFYFSIFEIRTLYLVSTLVSIGLIIG